MRDNKFNLVSKLMAVLILVAVALAALTLSIRAQTSDIYVDKQLGRADPVVHVGEYITFTIFIRNDTAFSVVTLPLSDTYNSAVLGFADASPMPDIGPAAGCLGWSNLLTTTPLLPGQSITVVVGFIAEHPETTVVNAAEVHDAWGEGGPLSDTISIHDGAESVGGSSPVNKELLAGINPQVGLPLTFTVVISNDGFTTMTVAPLVDTYNPAWMAFSYAVPPPDVVDQASGTLTWLDLTAQLGDVPAHGSLSVMTVFTALMAVDNATNSAQVGSASDWYGNDMAGGADNVPITIIGAPSTPTPVPTPAPTQQPAPTSAPAPAPTATLAPTPTEVIPLLPATGQGSTARTGIVMASVGLLMVLFIVARQARPVLRKD